MKKLEEIKELLLVVDTLNGFSKEGALADPYVLHTVPAQKKEIEETLNEDEEVAFLGDFHTMNCDEFKRYPVHCLENTNEAEVIDELKQYLKYARYYKKNSTSAIFAPNFMDDIKEMKKLKKIKIIGWCTDICDKNVAIPLKNYSDQYNRGIEVEVPEAAVETYNAPWHNREEYTEWAFKFMEQAGVKVLRKNKETIK